MTQPTKPRSEPSCGRGFDSVFGNLTGAGKQMALMSVSGDNQGWKTCVQVYNPAGFSMEFAAARSASIAYFQIAVWCGVPSHRNSATVRSCSQEPAGVRTSPHGLTVSCGF